ncbi:MAG: hypothetical protein WKF71_00185 [Pyrinomonadaceae bacterium]
MNTDERKFGESGRFRARNQRPQTEDYQKVNFRFSIPDSYWLAGCFIITAIAAFLRFFWLELKPFHHDEGVNGFF